MIRIAPKENNFFYLLGGLVFVLVLTPIAVDRVDGVVGIALTATLIVGVWSLARTRWAYVSGLVLAVASLAATGADLSMKSVAFAYVGLVAVFLFCAISLWIALSPPPARSCLLEYCWIGMTAGVDSPNLG